MTERPRVFVTGARRGIGRGIALAFAEAGYNVVINDIVEDDAAATTLADLRERGANPVFVKGNIADLGGLTQIADRAFDAFDGLECLVNNAGITVRTRGDILNVAPQSYDEVMNVNLRGPFFLTQEVARRMIGKAGKCASAFDHKPIFGERLFGQPGSCRVLPVEDRRFDDDEALCRPACRSGN